VSILSTLRAWSIRGVQRKATLMLLVGLLGATRSGGAPVLSYESLLQQCVTEEETGGNVTELRDPRN
jgi:hypothetical protein